MYLRVLFGALLIASLVTLYGFRILFWGKGASGDELEKINARYASIRRTYFTLALASCIFIVLADMGIIWELKGVLRERSMYLVLAILPAVALFDGLFASFTGVLSVTLRAGDRFVCEEIIPNVRNFGLAQALFAVAVIAASIVASIMG
jgi:hypothetical protein